MSKGSSGFQSRAAGTERRYEAHLFLTCVSGRVEDVVEIARRRRFRKSSRNKKTGTGAHDILLTRNSDDEQLLEQQLRSLADDLVAQDLYVYRIRLERMQFDEVRAKKG